MKYCTATSSGVGFFTHADREAAHLSGHPGNVWCVGDNNSDWIARVGGTEKTLKEAQALLDAAIEEEQAEWDSGEVPIPKPNGENARPGKYSLPT